MKSDDAKGYFDLFVYLMASVLPIFGIFTTESQTVAIVLIVLAVLLLAFFGFKLFGWVKERRISNSSMSNNSVINNIRRYCKSLLKYAAANKKQLLKNKNISKLSRLKAREDLTISQIKGENRESKRLAKIQIKLDKLRTKMTDAKALSLIKSLKPNENYLVSQLLSQTFVELERILLNAEQFDVRIKFGQYIKQFSDIEVDRIKADIDYMGWTYIMMGYSTKAEKAIISGIKRAEYLIGKPNIDIDKYDLQALIVRGYRHLGSVRKTYEKQPEEALKYLNLALELHNKMKPSPKQMNSYIQMETGINYGLMIAELYQFKITNDKENVTDEQYKSLYNRYLEFDKEIKISSGFSNKHRHTKYLVLKTKYLEVFLENSLYFKKHLTNKFNFDEMAIKDAIKESLNNIKDVFKENIFMDEALEYYLEERVKFLNYELIATIKGAII
ncbi:MAG TPA: hypothetical protein VJZ51_05645 [Bacilli bacterium]|nr:hypothetical protein [Bacilli bacterium]